MSRVNSLSHLVTLILVFAVCLPFAAFAQTVPPAQSTSGPEPFPQVSEKGTMPMAPTAPGGSSKAIAGVPGYSWTHGCGPTAVGMVVGYYDGMGFPDLYPGDAFTQTAEVNQGMASIGSGVRGSGEQRHFENYSLPFDSAGPDPIPDSSETYPVDCHADDSIADFMQTSWSSEGNLYGWSWSSRIIPAFASYVALKNPVYVQTLRQYPMQTGALTWEVLTQEIDANRPMVFLVDTDGNGGTDHFVTIVAYSDGPPRQYGCLDTWYPYEEVRWCNFSAMANGVSWGVWGGWSFRLQYALAVQAANGSVSRSLTQSGYDPGTTISLTATANPGYHFDRWQGDVPAGGESTNPLSLVMDGNKSLIAGFLPDTAEGEGESVHCTENPEQCPKPAGGVYTVGDSLCLSVPCPVAETSVYSWKKDSITLTSGARIFGADERTLQILLLEAADAGLYTCIYEDGGKSIRVFEAQVTVVEQTPAAGMLGLAALVTACAAFGIRTRQVRRR